MKKILIAFACMFSISALYSQATLNFCTYVDNEGYCAFNNNKFITTPDSANGRIFMKIYSAVPMGAKVTYKIFAVDKTGSEKLSYAFDQPIKEDWLSVWQPYVFATDAKYRVEVLNGEDKIICSKAFELVAGKQ